LTTDTQRGGTEPGGNGDNGEDRADSTTQATISGVICPTPFIPLPCALRTGGGMLLGFVYPGWRLGGLSLPKRTTRWMPQMGRSLRELWSPGCYFLKPLTGFLKWRSDEKGFIQAV
jgi:hypothetical protein